METVKSIMKVYLDKLTVSKSDTNIYYPLSRVRHYDDLKVRRSTIAVN